MLSWSGWGTQLLAMPILTIRSGSLELTRSPGIQPEARRYLLTADECEMRRDFIGWAGTRINRKPCIYLNGPSNHGPIELALYPKVDLDLVWQSLLDAGFKGRPPRGAL